MGILSYARVSTRDQDLTGQLDALKAAGAEAIYREEVNGVRADRPQLAKLMAKLMPGDFERSRLERVIERLNGEFQNPIDHFLQSA
jgi:DNA invertase Pin-like site-specific DNA recombinase